MSGAHDNDIIFEWESTPALFSARRSDYCGCGECNYPLGTGKTREDAKADLLEQESWREEDRDARRSA